MTEQVQHSHKTLIITFGILVGAAVLAMGIFFHWGIAAFLALAGGFFWGILTAFKSRDTLLRVVAFVFAILCFILMFALPMLLRTPSSVY